MKKLLTALLAVIILAGCSASAADANNTQEDERNSELFEHYGVFLSIDNTEMTKLEGYDTVVIDAQYFTSENLKQLHEDGHTVYSYINIGSIEDFREYYSDYTELFLGEYENWEEEQWIDTSSAEWQKFITDTLAGEMIEKGVDGFFVDNCDVYYVNNEEKIYQGVEKILSGLMSYDKEVIINSGDVFLDEYYDRYGHIDDIITGINQETVFTSIDFDSESFGRQTDDDSEYYREYIEKYGDMGAKIFLLEYTTDKSLIKQIKQYCTEKGFTYYVSDSIELD